MLLGGVKRGMVCYGRDRVDDNVLAHSKTITTKILAVKAMDGKA